MSVVLKSKVHKAQVGDVIRSLDFAGNYNHYMIGLVLEADDEVIRCRGISRVIEGHSQKIDYEFTTVQPGVHFMDIRCPGRIEVVG